MHAWPACNRRTPVNFPFPTMTAASLRTRVVIPALALLLVVAMPPLIRAKSPQALPMAALAADALGDAAFSVQDLEWNDDARARRVPVRLFLPASVPGRQVPLIVFSHGIGSSRDGYGYLGRYWASHGIASLHLQHVGSDRSLWQGNVLGLLSRFQHAAGEAEALDRAQDFHFALDRFLEGPHGQRIARERIVAAGHSYGANTTLLVSGAKVVRDGKLFQLRDPRVSAAIVISAPPFYGDADFRPILSGIHIPTLHVTSEDDVIHIPGYGSGVEDRLKVFDAMGGEKTLAVYKHGSHNVFTEKRYFDSVQVATDVKAATESLSLAFLQQVYGGHDELQGWGSRNAGLYSKYSTQ